MLRSSTFIDTAIETMSARFLEHLMDKAGRTYDTDQELDDLDDMIDITRVRDLAEAALGDV